MYIFPDQVRCLIRPWGGQIRAFRESHSYFYCSECAVGGVGEGRAPGRKGERQGEESLHHRVPYVFSCIAVGKGGNPFGSLSYHVFLCPPHVLDRGVFEKG